jgi:hypothetical protein
MNDLEELEQALSVGKVVVFYTRHNKLLRATFNSAARFRQRHGQTIVALHRAVTLAR